MTNFIELDLLEAGDQFGSKYVKEVFNNIIKNQKLLASLPSIKKELEEEFDNQVKAELLKAQENLVKAKKEQEEAQKNLVETKLKLAKEAKEKAEQELEEANKEAKKLAESAKEVKPKAKEGDNK
jgi:hypothetical protein